LGIRKLYAALSLPLGSMIVAFLTSGNGSLVNSTMDIAHQTVVLDDAW